MHFFAVLIATLSFVTASAAPKIQAQKKLSEDEIRRTYSLVQLNAAINGLRSVIDGQNWCGIHFDEAKNSILPLRPIYEKKLANEKEKKLPLKPLLAKSKTCKKDCTCRLVTELLKERADVTAEILGKFEKLALATTSKDLDNCAKRQTQLCQGPLLGSLKAISKKDYQAPSDF